jgi:hypothetical protein
MEKRIGFRSLVSGEKLKLIIWIKENESIVKAKAADILAKQASKELNLNISPSSILTFRKDIFPEMVRVKKHTPVGGKFNGGKIVSVLKDQDIRLTQFEGRLKLLETLLTYDKPCQK